MHTKRRGGGGRERQYYFIVSKHWHAELHSSRGLHMVKVDRSYMYHAMM